MKQDSKVKKARRAARQVIGEPSRNRKRGPHGDGRRPLTVADLENDIPDGGHIDGYIWNGETWQPDEET